MVNHFESVPKLIATSIFAFLLSSCGEGPSPKSAIQAFSKKTYATMDRKKEIRIISGTEIELSEGNLVGNYTREGNKIRAVFEAFGTKQSRYFIETDDGLTSEESREKYFTAEARKKIEMKIEDERQARIRKVDDDRQAAERLFASLPKEISLDLGNGSKLDLLRIRHGTFKMGQDYEYGPVHAVTISQPFYMGKYEVTQEQYEAVMGANPSHFKGAKNPVENVSWNDAQEFCRKLSAQTKKTVRLPTEAEWEYACRAGTVTAFYSGNDMETAGWHAGNSSSTHPVGMKTANAFGLYDMHGNVEEWCQDWYGRYEAGAQTDPAGPVSGTGRVFRGGCVGVISVACWSAFRNGRAPDYRGGNVGFSVVKLGFRVISAPLFKTP